MTNEEYKQKADKMLEEYDRALRIPIVKNNIYLGMDNEGKYLIVKWDGEFSLLAFMYQEYIFYDKFLNWDGVEIFLANVSEDARVEVIR